ncbi:DUF4974 domain-containing protein [Sabulilitoribacter arenilitoris]|uniref:DUF4974 domain-containing protein n=1 Tax=Wocania arenilitoris TaxID=2044858 RepID=A0AAE3JKU6_9FLAO|nr:FecR family protein [Wocania arenilitoris]MCF7567564.1 DUF4974 domain-containing protein [Wocania arenilitoris]
MNEKEVKKIFTKYINNECSEEEQELLDAFLDSYQDKEHVWSEFKIDSEEKFKKKSWTKIEPYVNNKDKKVKKLFGGYLKYIAAASVLLIFGLTLFFNEKNEPQSIAPVTVNKSVAPGVDKATLTLEDGSQVVLESGMSFQTNNANSNGEEIVYKTEAKTHSKTVYNHLNIPRGGQFSVKLSDGTQVWLNSESQLKYPVHFKEGEVRQVELIYGEAYFDVSPSEKNHGDGFRVSCNEQDVYVLGTEFNIKAYKDETNVYTTLVEGKVDVNTENGNQVLTPNQQLNLDVNTGVSSVLEVDVYNEVSWKEGVFSFNSKSLKEMMKVLSRWYDKDIVFKNKTIENEEFVGVLRKNENLEDILRSIKNFGVIKNFEIDDKKVILE